MQYNKFYGLFTAETPLCHGSDEKMETTTLCRFNTVLCGDGTEIKVYNISVAAYRNILRRHGARRLLHLVGLTLEEIPEIVNVILMSGGPRLEKGDIRPLEFIRFINHWFPLIDLLGTTFPFTITEGKLTPTALEVFTKQLVDPELTEFVITNAIMDAFNLSKIFLPDIVTEFQFNTKRDPRTGIKDPQNSECGTVANMFDTQVIRKGARLGHQILIRDYDNNLLESCVSSALEEWKQCGSHIGGKINQGMGQVSFEYLPELKSLDLYEDFVKDNVTKIKDIIMDKKVWLNKEINPYK